MQCIKSYEDLCRTRIYNKKQHWYYVLLINPRDLSPAGKVLINNLDYFDYDSGADCVYFIPGFLNTSQGIARGFFDFFRHTDIIKIPHYGNVQFFYQDFVDFTHQLEITNNFNWRYSGECELILFNFDDNGKIVTNDFASYNLDDIIRSGRNISSFIRETINIGMDVPTKREAKRKLDEIYSSIILPPIQHSPNPDSSFIWRRMTNCGFMENNYYFLSYSSKDYRTVSALRDNLERIGIKCWMAPRDIPHGTNYAHIIEIAIKNSAKFILVLSDTSVWSVWVEKELLRAIHHFQHESADRILAVWLNEQLDLDNTPMAYPIEGVQIAGSLKSEKSFKLLLPEDIQQKLNTKEKIEKTLFNFENNMFTAKKLGDQNSVLLSIAYSVNQHIKQYENSEISEKAVELNALCEKLKEITQKLKSKSLSQDDLSEAFTSSLTVSENIREKIADIYRLLK